MYVEPIPITIRVSGVSVEYRVMCGNDSTTVHNITGCGSQLDISGYWKSPSESTVTCQLSSTVFTIPCPSPNPSPTPSPSSCDRSRL